MLMLSPRIMLDPKKLSKFQIKGVLKNKNIQRLKRAGGEKGEREKERVKRVEEASV